jgi:chemosensory pili system protein ChpA (sensor histidine kinase/response regulator)
MFDPEVVAGFIQEANGYLPDILQNIEDYLSNRSSVEKLEEAYRYTHTIKGAASMLGFMSLSEVAGQLEEIMQDLGDGQLTVSRETAMRLRQAAIQLANQIDDLIGNYPQLASPQAMLKSQVDVAPGVVMPEPALAEAPAFVPFPEQAPGIQDDDPLELLSDLPTFGAEVSSPPVGYELAELPDFDTLFKPEPNQPTVSQRAEIVAAPVASTEAENSPLGFFDAEMSQELAEVFALEAEDHLRNMHQSLQALAEQPDDRELLQSIRRSAHSLKGAAAMVGFRGITKLAHRCEDLLDLLYEGQRQLTPEIRQLLFVSTDALEDLASGQGDAQKIERLYSQYAALLDAAALVTPGAAELQIKTAPPEPEKLSPVLPGQTGVEETAPELLFGHSLIDWSLPITGTRAEEIAEAGSRSRVEAVQGQATQFVRLPIGRLDELVNLASELVITRTTFEQRMADFARQIEDLRSSSNRLRRVSSSIETQYEAATLGGSLTTAEGADARLTSPLVNFTTHGFDELEFDRYTEFHLLSRELAETTSDTQTVGGELNSLISDFDSFLSRQSRLYSAIQDKLMRMRMVPLSTMATRLHRTVRNVAAEQGKDVELMITGEETEFDKTVIEELADPLQHLLRNAVDHGLETSDQRLALGKPVKGVIHISAYTEGTQVILQIRDDGRGLDPERLRATAVRQGIVANREEALQLGDEELWSLIFRPGFSTSAQVSEISGRGVGMDVVQSTITRLRGSISVESRPGLGTAFIIRLPMTLAVTQALMIKLGQQTYSIPLANVTQVLRIEKKDLDRVGQFPVINVNGKAVPLLWLSSLLHPGKGAEEILERQPALIIRIEGRQLALAVDQIIGGREIVIKNLGKHIRRMHGVMGATLMGDGSVVLILNLPELIRDSIREPMRETFKQTVQLKPLTPPTEAAPAAPVPSAPEAEAPVIPLPVTEAEVEKEKAPIAPPLVRAADSPITVMVIDDSPSVRRVTTNLIKNVGWNALQARDGLEALENLQNASVLPDLLLLDIEMPRMDGYQLLAALRAQPVWRALPVVMVTSRASARHRQKALDLGATDYLVKPYQDEVLLSLVRRLVNDSRATGA